MANYLRIIGLTLLAMSIVHGRTSGRWHQLHALGLTLVTMSITGPDGH